MVAIRGSIVPSPAKLPRGVAIGVRGCHTPPMSSFSAHLPNSAPQQCIADKAQGKPYLSANWARTKSVCRQIGV